MKLGRGQWLHRNDKKHTSSKPRHKRAAGLLQQDLIWLYMRRRHELLPGDRHRFDINLSDLLHRSPSYKQSWFLNMVAARNRCLRIRSGDPLREDMPPHYQDILSWIKGRPR